MTGPPELQEVNVMLPHDLVEYLQVEAQKRGVTAADVLQQAVVNDRYLREQQRDGSSVLLEKDTKFRKLAI